MTNERTPESVHGFYAAAARAAVTRLREHLVAQVATSLVCAALASAVAVFRGAGDLSFAYALWGAALYVVLAALVYFTREPFHLYKAQVVERDEASRSHLALLEEKQQREEIRLEFVKHGAAQLPGDPYGILGHPVHLVTIIVYNQGAGAYFSVSVLDQSVRGLAEAYPMGSFPLRWQMPNDTDRQWIPSGCDARVEVAVVASAARVLRFLGPKNTNWAPIEAVDDPVEGLIDFVVVGRDAKQRVHFALSIGTEHPVDLAITPVAHD